MVEDVPATSLRSLPQHSYTILRRSTGDHGDSVRREAFALLGTRYRSDIPPAPDDAFPADHQGDASGVLRHVPTEYPGLTGAAEVFVDDEGAVLTVRRYGCNGRGTQYGLPMTPERAELVDRMHQEFAASTTAYANLGAGPEAAARLSPGVWSPLALRNLLPLMRVADAEDANVLTSRSPDVWRGEGWDVDPTPHSHTGLREANPQRAWRASEAAALAAAGISADRAYELRDLGFGTVQSAVSEHARRPTEAARTAHELIRASQTPVPNEVGTALAAARRHVPEVVDTWRHEYRRSCGPEGWGLWAKLTHHTFVLAEGRTSTLWDVANGWWAIGEEGEEAQTSCVVVDEHEARGLWRSMCGELRELADRLRRETCGG
ncbi:hypothetical protein E3E14_30310 [Streptomyces sp. ICN441]|uniref:hypothetical protein n=1 Tax=Streptomyces sp. ICN441 TaxID=2558286 RepID=UPI00106B8E72|nr:hypothetical protein [Streptomyces sp. ICN441]TFE37109.1 hypothetical protein E3E14_30310 [Streptomyces sp. ICN441]